MHAADRVYDHEKLGKISKFFKIPTNSQDLLERHKLIYDLTLYCNGIFNISQAIDSDAIFALMITAKQVDRKYGTDYYKRARSILKELLRRI